MKISILTFSKELNNGAVLQCYALSSILQKMGHIVDVIDIQLPTLTSLPLHSRFFNLYNKFLFRSFHKKHLSNYTIKYKTVEQLLANPPKADAYIVGSDQVWNPDLTKRLDPRIYFLNFGDVNIRRISYAASFGRDSWEWNDLTDDVTKLLKRFNAVSVREESGKDICTNTFGTDCSVVCDPVFLRESYDNVCGAFDPAKQTKDLIYFKFKRDSKVDNQVAAFAVRHGLRAHCIKTRHKKKGFVHTAFMSVQEWLNAIRYADFVVSDSFHCLAFCILFHKKFLSMPAKIERAGRLYNLLQKLGLENRFCANMDELTKYMEYAYTTDIDYVEVDKKVKDFRTSALQFLEKALQ